MKTLSIAFAGLIGAIAMHSADVYAQPNNFKSVAAVYQSKDTLAGKTISAKGKVVKVNNEIMGRNFVHIQDGTGDAKSNDLLVTSKQTAKVGDMVAISGTVVLNRDFGSGYKYPLLIEDASITPVK